MIFNELVRSVIQRAMPLLLAAVVCTASRSAHAQINEPALFEKLDNAFAQVGNTVVTTGASIPITLPAGQSFVNVLLDSTYTLIVGQAGTSSFPVAAGWRASSSFSLVLELGPGQTMPDLDFLTVDAHTSALTHFNSSPGVVESSGLASGSFFLEESLVVTSPPAPNDGRSAAVETFTNIVWDAIPTQDQLLSVSINRHAVLGAGDSTGTNPSASALSFGAASLTIAYSVPESITINATLVTEFFDEEIEVPGPSAFSVLGLGGFVIARRRRNTAL